MSFAWFNPRLIIQGWRHKGNRHFTFTRSPETRLVPNSGERVRVFSHTVHCVCVCGERGIAKLIIYPVRMLRQVVDFSIVSNFQLPCCSLCCIIPLAMRSGISTASQGPSWGEETKCDIDSMYNESILNQMTRTNMWPLTPSAIKWASPNFGTFLAHSGLKWSVKQILPPLLGWNKM